MKRQALLKCLAGMVLVLGSMSVVGVSHGQTASFEGLGFLANGGYESFAQGVSGDGLVVVGSCRVGTWREAFRWTRSEGMVRLGDLNGGTAESSAYAATPDGSIIVGYADSGSGHEAFRWTASGGMVGLGDLPNGGFYSEARDVSDSGLVICGWGRTADYEPCFWTGDDAPVALRDRAGGRSSGFCQGISGDGTIIAGYGGPGEQEPFRWTEASGTVGLGKPPGGKNYAYVTALSGDGHVVVAYTDTDHLGEQSFRWVEDAGWEPIGERWALDASLDGSVIVGEGSSGAFLWTEEHGSISLQEVLEQEFGLDLSGWYLSRAYAVSDDGNVIVGYGRNPDGNTEAWRAVIPEPATMSLLALGGLALIRRRRR